MLYLQSPSNIRIVAHALVSRSVLLCISIMFILNVGNACCLMEFKFGKSIMSNYNMLSILWVKP